MKLFKKRNRNSDYNVLIEEYHPVTLPSEGLHQETVVPCDYAMNQPEVIETCYKGAEDKIEHYIKTCDHHSSGHEMDYILDSYSDHIDAFHAASIPHHNNQITRILNVRSMRINYLFRKIDPLSKRIEELKNEIEPLKDLKQQFTLRIGPFSVSMGILVTILSIIFDSALNFNKLQDYLLTNPVLLGMAVVILAFMSDGSMCACSLLLSRRKEDFMPRKLFNIICIGLLFLFLLSVIGSIMLHWGSMAATYGTINAQGEFVAPASYNLAQYGITLIMSQATTCTAILSFFFSYDEKAYLVSRREQLKKELKQSQRQLDPLLNELLLLLAAPDPKEYDNQKRKAAERQLENVRKGIKKRARERLALQINEAGFTEKMALDEDSNGKVNPQFPTRDELNSKINYDQMS